MSALADERCVPCHGGVPPMNESEIAQMLPEVPGWEVLEIANQKRLQRTFKFPDFVAALEFTNRIGQIAEAEGHHPLMITEWGKVTVAWWTHAIGGLHRNDFIMAAKTNQIYAQMLASG
ncbi:4a-hydroxytetrahydrobiopterin dehydratase [uncultured Thermanaerothrix sp.]|uniref:4a-hydroxytetrahydrobiopterin dehydratase n=1 Tax=uncultured Thermanaerothrix sp. TaxID=1195149 RepID=UPI00262FACA1|nr:4a-hydroxytetrahydrobiopterin dehydratase [uncultured Thermanaerothrix sp.]